MHECGSDATLARQVRRYAIVPKLGDESIQQFEGSPPVGSPDVMPKFVPTSGQVGVKRNQLIRPLAEIPCRRRPSSLTPIEDANFTVGPNEKVVLMEISVHQRRSSPPLIL